MSSPYEFYKSELLGLHENLVRTLGTTTVVALIERGVEEASVRYASLSGIAVDDRGLDFSKADAAFAQEPPEEVQAAFSALYGLIIVLLARMLGREIALRIADRNVADAALRGQLIAPN